MPFHLCFRQRSSTFFIAFALFLWLQFYLIRDHFSFSFVWDYQLLRQDFPKLLAWWMPMWKFLSFSVGSTNICDFVLIRSTRHQWCTSLKVVLYSLVKGLHSICMLFPDLKDDLRNSMVESVFLYFSYIYCYHFICKKIRKIIKGNIVHFYFFIISNNSVWCDLRVSR